jgi:hypothetical protein
VVGRGAAEGAATIDSAIQSNADVGDAAERETSRNRGRTNVGQTAEPRDQLLDECRVAVGFSIAGRRERQIGARLRYLPILSGASTRYA